MNRLTFGALAAATAIILPFAAQAQQLPPAVIGVVDSDQIFRTCTTCVAANAQLQAQVQQLQARATALGTPLQTEEQALTTAVNALPQGSNPDAALAQRIQTYQTNRQNAQTELANRQQQIERNVQFVRQQIGQRVQPAIQQVMQQRGATIVVDRGATLGAAPTVDITPAVLAIVNQNTTPLNVNAPPPQAPPAATPTQPQPPRPQGR
jgi:Skp family chaperone for outer membrane proteins